MYCERPDRDVPGIVCGHPLPCPYHTATIDVTGAVPTVTIPVASVPAIRRDTLETLKDISQQKRLAVLARVFFHDVLNTAGGISGFSQLVRDDLPSNSRVAAEAELLVNMSERLITEIESQRDLIRAEQGDLEIDPEPVRTLALLEENNRIALNPLELTARGWIRAESEALRRGPKDIRR